MVEKADLHLVSYSLGKEDQICSPNWYDSQSNTHNLLRLRAIFNFDKFGCPIQSWTSFRDRATKKDTLGVVSR